MIVAIQQVVTINTIQQNIQIKLRWALFVTYRV